jgi:hypothetical protein
MNEEFRRFEPQIITMSDTLSDRICKFTVLILYNDLFIVQCQNYINFEILKLR